MLVSDTQIEHSQSVRIATIKLKEANPKLLPLIVILAEPMLSRLTSLMILRVLKSEENDWVKLPFLMPAVKELLIVAISFETTRPRIEV
jgi:hypothetical protein